jgi:hypothetical protein
MPIPLRTTTCRRCGADSEEGVAYCSTCGASLNASDLSQGVQVDAVFGSYRLLQQIGEGGMGRVFVAEHTRLGRHVAIKILRSEYAGNVEAVKRFFSEARAVNLIKHENIIEISDFVENDNGRSYYIMELLTGTDLRRLLDREQVLPVSRAVAIGLQMARAIAAAHACGIIHRDLKPDNVFLIERGGQADFVKMLDFGVAKLQNPTGEEKISTFKTSAGIVVGTPDYMSPEQGAGKAIDHRTDIYSLGVVLFEMVTGQRPFRAESFGELMIQHMTAAPPRPSTLRAIPHSLPPALERLILACLAKEPEGRPVSMNTVARVLEAIARGDAEDEVPLDEKTAIRAARRGRSSRLAWVAAGVAILAGGSAWWWRSHARATGHESHAVAQPAAPPALAVEPMAIVQFRSRPPGAAVFADGATAPLGVTPFSATLTPSARAQTFEFRLEGHATERGAIAIVDGAQLEVTLAPVSPPVSPGQSPPQRAPTKRHSPRSDRTAVLNPFK